MGDGPPDGVVLEIDRLPEDVAEMAEEPILGIEPPEISRGDEPAEDFALGPQHGAFLLALAAALWWFFLRKGGSGGHSAQPAANVDKEELRRKRLEALAARASATTNDAAADEGLRKRSTAAPERTEEQKPKTPERQPAPVPEPKSPAAKPEAPVATAPAAPVAAPESPAAAAAAEPEPPAAPREEAPAPPAEEEQPAAPAKEEEPPSPGPAAEEPLAPQEPPAPEPPSDFSVQLRSTLQGSSRTERLGGFTGDSTVGGLRDLAAATFQTGAEARLRLFFNGKELKSPEATFAALGIAANATVQVMVSAPVATSSSSGQPGTPKGAVAAAPAAAAPSAASSAAPPAAAGAATTAPAEPAATAAVAESSTPAPAEAAGPVSLRVQGSLQGATAVHTVEASSSSSVAELEEQILEKFGAAGQRLRLFYMGRELKDREKSVGSVAFKPGAMLQAMFAAGTARASKTRPSAPSSPTAAEAPAASEAAPAARPDAEPAPPSAPEPQVVCGPEGCRLVTPEAPPCGTATPAVASAAPAEASAAPAAAAPAANGQAVSPEEAWRAMAGLEEQLARAVDDSEAQDVRQAAQVLKQMLTTMTHGDNPALMQFAQAAVPDLSKIWGFGPTREHLQGLLGAPQPAPAAPGSAAAGSAS